MSSRSMSRRCSPERFFFAAAVAVALAGCVQKSPVPVYPDAAPPDVAGPSRGAGGDVPGVLPPSDATIPGEGDVATGPDTTGSSGGQDGGFATPDAAKPDASTVGVSDAASGDGQAPPADAGPPPVPEKPQVLGAFSADGETVTVRFSKLMDPASAGDASHYQILGSDNTLVEIASASASGRFAHLTLAATAAIDPALTYTVFVKDVADAEGNPLDTKHAKAVIKRSVYLAIVWHQHQPLYYDPIADELSGPWVRAHATKDYYDMAAVLAGYPDVHVTVNLTVVLLRQLQIYLDRLGPYVDPVADTVDEAAFLAKWKGHTDPWIDLLLEDTPTPQTATKDQLELLYDGPWSTVSTSDVVMSYFPEYEALRDKNEAQLTQDDFRALKIFFALAWFDPDFLDGPVELPNGWVVDLSDVVTKDAQGRYWLAVEPTEELANRLVAESYEVMANVVPIHAQLRYHPADHTGQIEVTTTPFYHPILPLLVSTDEAKQGQPFATLPDPPFAFPEDATAQVARAVHYYTNLFGEPPRGMWPGEGSVSESVVPIFAGQGIEWVATGQEVLERSTQPGKSVFYPYRVDAGSQSGTPAGTAAMAILFRDQKLSDKIGFEYSSWAPEAAVDDFIGEVLSRAPAFGGKDRLVVVVLDGENAWENYRYDLDAKQFFHLLYQRLEESAQVGDVLTVTPTEYIEGNPERAIPPHPVETFEEIEPLWAGSWIGGTFDIWIGEPEENDAWDCLRKVRSDLQLSGLAQPNPSAPPPSTPGTFAWALWKAWDEMYAAEGSDWFWWYGDDMTSPANDDTPFDEAFRTHLQGVYEFANQALALQGKAPLQVFQCPPIIQKKPKVPKGPFTKPPAIDGAFVPNEVEWTGEGGFFFDDDSGVAANPNDDIKAIYYGYDADNLYLAIDAGSENLGAKLGTDYRLVLYLSHKHIVDLSTGKTEQNPANGEAPEGVPLKFKLGGAAWRLLLDFAPGALSPQLQAADGSGGWTDAPENIAAGGPLPGGGIVELRIPWGDLDLAPGDPLELFALAVQGGEILDAAPNKVARVLFEDESDKVFVVFEVDVSGKSGPIDKYVDIANPPPPKGKGIVFIAGNHPSLCDWVPNKCPMVDDGQGDDAVAGDQKWTLTVGLPRGFTLRWKYTIGLNTDEKKWTKTEEFPLTERGYDVPLDPAVKKVIIHDIFADRPQPTGTLGPHTTVETLKE